MCERVNPELPQRVAGKPGLLKVQHLHRQGRDLIIHWHRSSGFYVRVKDHTHRPILNNDMSLSHVKELMEKREPRYQSVADVKISVDANDRILTCYQIITELEELGVVQI